MVEKIIVNPNEIRGYGNILNVHSSTDYDLSDCTIESGTDTVNGASATVYTLTPTASHSYSLSFSSSSYTAVGGTAEVSCTLTDSSVAVSGATISFTGGSSTVTATTNSSGVATATITVTETSTITATFGNATDTCTITYSSYIYQSAMTSDDNKWTASGGGRTVTYSSSGCNVTGTATSDGFYKLDETKVTIPSEFKCEFDITAATEGAYSESTDFVVGNISIRKQSSKLRIGQLSGGTDYQVNWPSTPIHIKIEYGASTATVYVEGTSVGTWNTSYSYIGFKTYNQRSITIKNLEISGDSPSPTPTGYSLAFSQSTYTLDMFGETNVSCTLKNGNTPMSGQTITFSWEGLFGPQSATATTNSSGVAALPFSDSSFSSLPATVTATYSGATATCTIEAGGGGGGIV